MLEIYVYFYLDSPLIKSWLTNDFQIQTFRKTEGDWCLVQPDKETRAIYIPASYVRPLYRTQVTISDNIGDAASNDQGLLG